MNLPPPTSFWQRLTSRRRPGPTAPLPRPIVDPRTPVTVLIAAAEARAAEEVGAHVFDSWSFGHPGDELSAHHDPGYVAALREMCEGAVQSARERHAITESRVHHLREQSAEANRFMAAARSMMDRLAVRDARAREPVDEHPPVGDPPEGATEDIADDDPVWEGETTVLGIGWRVAIMVGLVAALTGVHYLFFSRVAGAGTSPTAVWVVCAAMAVFLVVGPHVTALMLRARQATGTERRLAWVVGVTGTAWTGVVVVLGIACAAVLREERERLERLDLVPITVVLMFIGGLVVAGAVAFMLGLSRRHPYQEAYARHRARRDRVEGVRRQVVDQVDPEHVEADDEETALDALTRAIRAGYASAEESYFAALARAAGDASFTEAVLHRRGLRRGVRP
ncbi:hypothetical protein ACTG9Q_13270 [Actinokineospora sp. 24-640]